MRGMAGKRKLLGTYYRIFLGMVLLMLVFLVVMALHRPPRPTLPMTRQQADDAVGGSNPLAHAIVVKSHMLFEDHSFQ